MMSANTAENDVGTPLPVLPRFDLHARFDDPNDPASVTVSPTDADDPSTEWLTVDVGYVIPIEETV